MKSFTLASFNIGAASKMYNRYDVRDLDAISDCIKSCGADVVALQEVDLGCQRSQGVDMASYICGRAEYPYRHFITIRPFQGGLYGTSLISRFPIKDKDTINYRTTVAKQGTSCGYISFELGGRDVTVFNTHLSCESSEANLDTMRCLDSVLSEYKKERGGFLCCGDFNTSTDVIAENIPWVNYCNRSLKTYADVSIDNILYTEGFETDGVRVIDAVTDMISDHNMLICGVRVL